MMEIAAVDDSVRDSEDGQTVERFQPESQQERARLVGYQEDFCELFPELVEDMAELGVTLKKKSDLPPSEATSVAFSVAGAQTGEGTTPTDEQRRKRIHKEKPGEQEMK